MSGHYESSYRYTSPRTGHRLPPADPYHFHHQSPSQKHPYQTPPRGYSRNPRSPRSPRSHGYSSPRSRQGSPYAPSISPRHHRLPPSPAQHHGKMNQANTVYSFNEKLFGWGLQHRPYHQPQSVTRISAVDQNLVIPPITHPTKFRSAKSGFTKWALRVVESDNVVRAYRNNQFIFSFRMIQNDPAEEAKLMRLIDEMEGTITNQIDQAGALPPLLQPPPPEPALSPSKNEENKLDEKTQLIDIESEEFKQVRAQIRDQVELELEEKYEPLRNQVSEMKARELEQEEKYVLIENSLMKQAEEEKEEDKELLFLKDKLASTERQLEDTLAELEVLKKAKAELDLIRAERARIKAEEEKKAKEEEQKKKQAEERRQQRIRDLEEQRRRDAADRKLADIEKRNRLKELALRAREQKLKETHGPLIQAIIKKQKQKVKKYLYFELDDPAMTEKLVNVVDHDGKRAVHHAASKRNGAILKILLAAQAEMNHLDNFGNSALHYACKMNDNASVRLLMRYGETANHINKEGKMCWEMLPNMSIQQTQMHAFVKKCAEMHNRPPELNIPIENVTISVGQMWEMQLPADTFLDKDGDELEYAAHGMPGSIKFIPKTRRFRGAPQPADAVPDELSETQEQEEEKGYRRYEITVTASDDYSQSSTTFILTINASTDNTPPEVKKRVPPQIAKVGQPFTFTFDEGTFYDADGDELNYSAEGMPSSFSFDGKTRTFTGTPEASEAVDPNDDESTSNDWTITIVADDGQATASAAVMLTIEA